MLKNKGKSMRKRNWERQGKTGRKIEDNEGETKL